MPAPDGVESTTLLQRLALLALTELDERETTPANPVEVRGCCRSQLESVETEDLAHPSEVEITRALNELAASDLVDETESGDSSPVGKGRPTYVVRVDRENVLKLLADDDRLAGIVDGSALDDHTHRSE